LVLQTTARPCAHQASLVTVSKLLWSQALAAVLQQVITTINTGKLFYCGVFHPDDDKQNVLMSGCGDKKIYQFDLNSGDVEQVGSPMHPVQDSGFV